MKADIERTEDGEWGSSCYGFNSLIGIENKRKMDLITIHFCKNGRNTFRDIFRSGSSSLRVEFRSDVIILRILRKIYYCFLLLDNFPFSLYRFKDRFKLRIIQFIVYSSGDDALYKNIVSFITPLSTSYFAHLALRAIYLIFHMFHLSCFIFCISNFILSVSRFLFVLNCNLFNKKRWFCEIIS